MKLSGNTFKEKAKIPQNKKQNRQINAHKNRSPKNKKIFECTIYDKKYYTLQELKSHQLIHKDEKPFQCKFCDKRFKRLQNLKDHEFTHSDEKPFKCDGCEKSFRTKTQMKTHKNNIHFQT